MAAKVAALESAAQSLERMALGKLVELRRRQKGLTAEELAKQARVTPAALLNLEHGIRLPNTPDVTALVAPVLDLPAEKLAALAGGRGPLAPAPRAAASQFTAQTRSVVPLSPAEQSALGHFLEALAVA